MITEWTVGNFKSIADPTTLNLAPLTLIAGANNAGKSTILQSLLIVAQTFDSHSRARALILNGQLARLGQFSDLLHATNRAMGRCSMDLGFALDFPRSLATQVERIELEVSVEAAPESQLPVRQALPMAKRYELGIRQRAHMGEPGRYGSLDLAHDSQPVRAEFSYRIAKMEGLDEGQPRSGDISFTHVIMNGLVPVSMLMQFNPDVRRAGQDLDRLILMLVGGPTADPTSPIYSEVVPQHTWRSLRKIAIQGPRYGEDLRRFVNEEAMGGSFTWGQLARVMRSVAVSKRQDDPGEAPDRIGWGQGGRLDLARRLEGMKRESLKEVELGSKQIDYGPRPLPFRLQEALAQLRLFWADRFFYLGPLRDDPKVIFAAPTDLERRNVGVKGEFTAAVLSEYGDAEIAYPLPIDQIETEPIVKTGTGSLNQAVTHWLEYMGLVDSVSSQERAKIGYELTVKPLGLDKGLDLMNVGVGVSQVLPTLVMSLIAPTDSILVFEQPELHLHPRVQAILGDFLIGIASMGKQCLVETHSERIINRVRRRIAEAPRDSIMRLVRIYFAEREDSATQVFEVEPNEYGAIARWPRGFFDEGPEEAVLIGQAATRKREAKSAQKALLPDAEGAPR